MTATTTPRASLLGHSDAEQTPFPFLSSQITTQILCNVGHTPLHRSTRVLSLVTAPCAEQQEGNADYTFPKPGRGSVHWPGGFFPIQVGITSKKLISITGTCAEVRASLLKTTMQSKSNSHLAFPASASPALRAASLASLSSHFPAGNPLAETSIPLKGLHNPGVCVSFILLPGASPSPSP